MKDMPFESLRNHRADSSTTHIDRPEECAGIKGLEKGAGIAYRGRRRIRKQSRLLLRCFREAPRLRGFQKSTHDEELQNRGT